MGDTQQMAYKSQSGLSKPAGARSQLPGATPQTSPLAHDSSFLRGLSPGRFESGESSPEGPPWPGGVTNLIPLSWPAPGSSLELVLFGLWGLSWRGGGLYKTLTNLYPVPNCVNFGTLRTSPVKSTSTLSGGQGVVELSHLPLSGTSSSRRNSWRV